MFGFGKKEKKEERQPSISMEEWMYETICMNVEGAQNRGAFVEIPGASLKVWAEFFPPQPQMLQMALHCSHPEFTDEIEEFLVGPGNDTLQQLQDLAGQAMGLVLAPILSVLTAGECERKITRLDEEEHEFYSGVSNTISRCRDRESMERHVPRQGLFERFEQEILEHVGKKNNYWIKLYESHFGNEINCEARINNRIVPELTALLTEDVQNCAAMDWDQKQTVLLLQDPSTRTDGLFTAAQIQEYAGQAIHMLAGEVPYDDIYGRLLELTGDESLSFELLYLLPEIFCFRCLQDFDTCRRKILLYRPGQQESLALNESQIGSYNWMETAVERYLSEERPDNSVLLQIIRLSSSAGALSAAMEKGSSMKNGRHFIALNVPEHYVLR